jgi:hypothetical protein
MLVRAATSLAEMDRHHEGAGDANQAIATEGSLS